ncbi:HD domain-containing protein [Lentibacillus amyloliquefaciens]|uniref:Metal-dependent phosphohydrolase n=1 Tax=Lentibacillus amyloliquefaciens TaxID=1472767 RepID=A0A0U3W426_9BACI|nr:HD domain-containing protein [Lentibacillus amyloliquefaciens]ALX47920.1 metal-dependent phosphohydrolase [Lentibacillus amyloliquefaciens]
MNTVHKLNAIKDYIYTVFNDDATGHDFFHMKRVAFMAKHLAVMEQADHFICEAAGWVHDIGDRKLFSNRAHALKELDNFLQSIDCTADEISTIRKTVEDISFSKGKTPANIEGKIVQDADRLDAIGAVGIARTFAFGAAKGQLLWHDHADKRDETSVQHFYAKLLHLNDSMNTAAAKQIANQRHQFMETYLQQFFREWQ